MSSPLELGLKKMPAPKLTKAAVSNILSATADAGLEVSAIDVNTDGSLRIEFGAGKLKDNANVVQSEKVPKK
ncbi:hypothetical protein [Roseovarius sp. D22-M7]|uniref:hypothetical protein n=1 Tax=Roseovarius sp. D22-M7 TaxID=3127116 RepID=UPI0030103CC4